MIAANRVTRAKTSTGHRSRSDRSRRHCAITLSTSSPSRMPPSYYLTHDSLTSYCLGIELHPRSHHLEDVMRKIIASLFVSLDGVAEAPDTWHFPYFDDEMGNAVGAAMANSDAMLLGRVQYQQFASYWPTSEDEVADIMNNQKKYVVTNTLTEATWNNTEIISGEVLDRIKALKTADGKD